MCDIEKIKSIVSSIETFLIDIRRDLHMHPELGMEEFRTMKVISGHLKEMKVFHKCSIANTGIVADIEGEDKSFTVAFRADIDALPIEDLKECEYASKEKGKCHACGHDVHTTIAIGVAKIFSIIKPPCNVRIIFEPAEETTGGALPMIQSGVLDNVDVIYGLHVNPDIETGRIGIKYGAMYASSNMFDIKIYGKSAHGARAYDGIDAIEAASRILKSLRYYALGVKDVVLHIGAINGGKVRNVVADFVEMNGIIRTLLESKRADILREIKSLVINIAEDMGAKAEFIDIPSYPALINHDNAVDVVKKNVKFLLSEKGVFEEPSNMTTEDFSYFLQNVQGAFFSLGVGNDKNNVPIHNGLFDIDESSINIGVCIQVMNLYETYKERSIFRNKKI